MCMYLSVVRDDDNDDVNGTSDDGRKKDIRIPGEDNNDMCQDTNTYTQVNEFLLYHKLLLLLLQFQQQQQQHLLLLLLLEQCVFVQVKEKKSVKKRVK